MAELEKKVYSYGEMNGSSDIVDIIYEDNHILSVVKPQGILSQSDDSGDRDFLSVIKEDIARRANKPGAAFCGLVHRLDRNTGGTMVFAKTSKGASRLSEQLRNKRFYKGYFAIAEGIIDINGGRLLKDKLLKNDVKNIVTRSESGKPCELYIEVVAAGKKETLVFAVPITGRTHQIRAQLSLFGHPLAGDVKYGGSEAFGVNGERSLALWSSIVAVKHPTKDVMCVFKSTPEAEGLWSLFDKTVYEQFAEKICGDGFERFIRIKGDSL